MLRLKSRHRIMCGDSTSETDVSKLMDGEKADMVLTDPPYDIKNVNQKTRNHPNKHFGNIGKSIEHIASFDPSESLNRILEVFENKKMNAYIFCNKDLLGRYLSWGDKEFSPNLLVWKKPKGMPVHRHYQFDVEYICYFRKGAIFNNKVEGVEYSKVQEFSRANINEKGENNNHPTVKPIDLLSNIIKISSNKESLVLDLFLGSGSTLIACEKTNRKCYGMELDEHYMSVILKRYEDYSGGTIVKT